jgi:hypothetical protein
MATHDRELDPVVFGATAGRLQKNAGLTFAGE